MSVSDIEQRIALGEDSRTEFKSAVKCQFKLDADDLAKAVVCLANSGGGEIFVGVENDGRITGAGTPEQADQLILQITQVCNDNVHLNCPIEKVAPKGTLILMVRVPGYAPGRPFQDRKGRRFVRRGNSCHEATNEELRRMLESTDHHYDEQTVREAVLADLDLVEARRLWVQAYGSVPVDDIPWLRALKCIDRESTPTVSGILMFGRDPQRFLPDARISTVRVRGTVVTTDFLDRKELTGSLVAQVEAARAFLNQHVVAPAHVEGWERKETGIPAEVLREALNNAVVHRDYRAASQIRIFVFDDRVEFVNPGKLMNQLDLDSIRVGGISLRRNPVLASLGVRLLLGRESYGFGVLDMIRRMKDRGLPAPEFDDRGGHFRVILRFAPATGAQEQG